MMKRTLWNTGLLHLTTGCKWSRNRCNDRSSHHYHIPIVNNKIDTYKTVHYFNDTDTFDTSMYTIEPYAHTK